MGTAANRVIVTLFVVVVLAGCMLPQAHAQSSLGIGTAEPSMSPTGWLGPIFQWVNVQQQSFYRAMTAALKGMRTDGSQLWVLVGLSFAYGIFHAAGPGHGKVVISSYVLANNVTLRRGLFLSLISSLLQALSAIVIIGAVFLLLRGTAISMTGATWFLEVASYGLIAVFGAWLLARKLRAILPVSLPRPALATAGGPIHALFDAEPDCRQSMAVEPARFRAQEATAGSVDVCKSCGQSHAVDPIGLGDVKLDLRSAWAAIVAVGIRPCSGALIVLTFSLLNGIWLGGIVSVFAMALGTAVTVSILAVLAVTAKDVAIKVSGSGSVGVAVHHALELAGAAALLLIGLLLLGASLS